MWVLQGLLKGRNKILLSKSKCLTLLKAETKGVCLDENSRAHF